MGVNANHLERRIVNALLCRRAHVGGFEVSLEIFGFLERRGEFCLDPLHHFIQLWISFNDNNNSSICEGERTDSEPRGGSKVVQLGRSLGLLGKRVVDVQGFH